MIVLFSILFGLGALVSAILLLILIIMAIAKKPVKGLAKAFGIVFAITMVGLIGGVATAGSAAKKAVEVMESVATETTAVAEVVEAEAPTEAEVETETEPETEAPVPVDERLETDGTVYTLGDWEVAATSSAIVSEIAMSAYTKYTPEDGSKFLKVDISVTNKSKEMETFLPLIGVGKHVSAIIISDEGYQFSPTSILLGVDDNLYQTSLNPLESKSGFVAFSIPDVLLDTDEGLTFILEEGKEQLKFKIR